MGEDNYINFALLLFWSPFRKIKRFNAATPRALRKEHASCVVVCSGGNLVFSLWPYARKDLDDMRTQ